MKRLNCATIRLVLIGVVAAFVLGAGRVKADFTFGEPTNLGPMINSPGWDTGPCVSSDGLEFYYASDRPGGSGGDDLYVTTRPTVSDPWGEPVNLGRTVNSSSLDYGPSISADGLSLYFSSERPDGCGDDDIWLTIRMTKGDPWGEPVNLGPTINSLDQDHNPSISTDGLTLYFSSDKDRGRYNEDIWMSTRHTTQDEWGIPVNLGPIVNDPAQRDGWVDISCDNLVLFLSYRRTQRWEIWMTRRKSIKEDWERPVNLGSPVNDYHAYGPSISHDGSMLYFNSNRLGGSGSQDLWQAEIIPIVDLNGDGIVNAADLCIMVDHWGTDNSLCDIGPMPWGDGVVDVEDMKVLAKHLFEDYRLIAHWELDETEGSIAYDNAGQYDADLHGGPLWQPSGGKVAGALQLDGIDDYVSTPFILNPAKGSLSVSAWMKGGAPGQVMISQRDLGRDPGNTWLMADASYGRLMTRLMHPPFPPLVSESVITDDQWHHVGLVFDIVGLHRYLYVDGAEVAKDSDFVGGVGSDGGLYIGAGEILAATSFFSGLIDDVRIYNAALSAEEIAALIQ